MNEKELNMEDLKKLQDAAADLLIKSHRRNHRSNESLKQYHQTRKLHQQIIDKMSDFFNDYQDACEEIVNQGFNQYDLDCEISFNYDDGLQRNVFGDFFIYPHFNDSLSELFLREKKVRSEANKAMIQAMIDSKLGLYQVKDIDEEDCNVFLENVLTGEKITIVDERMALLNKKDMIQLLCLRVITYKGLSFQTGLCIGFEKNDPTIRKWIKKHKKHKVKTDFLLEIYLYYCELSKKHMNIPIEMRYVK